MVANDSRRGFLKRTGTVAAAGALGSLAGCSSGDDSSPDTTESSASGSDSDDSGSSDDGGSQESVTVKYWGYVSGISGATKEHYRDTWEHFSEVHDGKIEVNFTSILDAGRAQKMTSAVEAGNPPDAAESGALGIDFFRSGAAADMTPYIGETDIPDNLLPGAWEAAKYRDKWWSGGNKGPAPTMLSITPQLFKDAGAGSPDDLSTWTGFRQALDQIQENNDNIIPWQEAAAKGDLEANWGYARTAYTDGTNPYLDVSDQGTPDDPHVKIGEEGATDGMMKHTVDMARTYSKDSGLGNLDVPPMMLTDRVASAWGSGSSMTYTAVDDSVEFGWDGDIMELPFPKVTPSYAEEYGIADLEGVEGEHGGHAWGLSTSTQTFESSEVKDEAWAVQKYDNFNEWHVVRLWSEAHQHVAPTNRLNQKLLEAMEEQGGVPQPFQASVDALDEYGSQYMVTGANWDVPATNSIRTDAVNNTVRQAIAGEIDTEEVPGTAREKTQQFLEESS